MGGSPNSDSVLPYPAGPISSLACKHGAHDHDGKPWPHNCNKEKSITAMNHIDPNDSNAFDDIWRVMDSTIFEADKRGWDESWEYLVEHRADFEYLFMNTNGGYRGLELICVYCRRSCTLLWDKKSTSAEAYDAIRKTWLSFLCQHVLLSSGSKPIVCQRLYFEQAVNTQQMNINQSAWAPDVEQ